MEILLLSTILVLISDDAMLGKPNLFCFNGKVVISNTSSVCQNDFLHHRCLFAERTKPKEGARPGNEMRVIGSQVA